MKLLGYLCVCVRSPLVLTVDGSTELLIVLRQGCEESLALTSWRGRGNRNVQWMGNAHTKQPEEAARWLQQQRSRNRAMQ